MDEHISRVSSPQHNKGKKIHITVCPQAFNVRYSSQVCPNSILFLSVGIVKIKGIELKFKINRRFTKVFLIPVKPVTIPRGPSKPCENPRSEVFARALFHVGDISSICCELQLDKQ